LAVCVSKRYFEIFFYSLFIITPWLSSRYNLAMTSQQGRSRQLMALGILLVLAMVSITSVNAAVDIDYANLEKRGTVFVSSFVFWTICSSY
jgi:hypothetical protein